nr:HNH endonuclease family protein [Acinetobacter johnsonii]
MHNENDFRALLSQYNSSKLTRSLLLLDAYLTPNQNELITTTLDIEHIFPKKWQDTNYNGWSRADTDEFLEKLGNKVICEKKLNIQAGNGYFGIKKARYAQ